jgi:hypothetical protein
MPSHRVALRGWNWEPCESFARALAQLTAAVLLDVALPVEGAVRLPIPAGLLPSENLVCSSEQADDGGVGVGVVPPLGGFVLQDFTHCLVSSSLLGDP